jgi:hypothetical protein
MEFSSAFPKTLSVRMQYERATMGSKRREISVSSRKQLKKCDNLVSMLFEFPKYAEFDV